jgi:hypothetical protein
MSRIPRHAVVRPVVLVWALEFDVPRIEVEDYYLSPWHTRRKATEAQGESE